MLAFRTVTYCTENEETPSWVGLVMLVAPTWSPSPVRFVYNATDSAPRGWYVVEPASRLRVGEAVVVRLPGDVAAFAVHRHYLPAGVPLIKSVAAIAPQHVCVTADGVHIDGHVIAAIQTLDASGRVLTSWQGCRQLFGTELFLLGRHPASFDSRYFGPVDAAQAMGRARQIGKGGSS